MKTRLMALLVFLCSLTFLFGNDFQAKGFVKKVIGTGWLIDTIQTRDGAYVSLSTGGPNFLVRKITPSGAQEWTRSLQISVDPHSYASLEKIVETANGYVLVGEIEVGGYYGYL